VRVTSVTYGTSRRTLDVKIGELKHLSSRVNESTETPQVVASERGKGKGANSEREGLLSQGEGDVEPWAT